MSRGAIWDSIYGIRDNRDEVNVPHQFFKVHGIGDVYSPKNVTLTQEQRYQNVRIIAVYETDQIPALRG